ncbi:MAG: hypothetical protein HYW64_01855 [Candidatus Levybacteria bacterium]|nr:hypothetical protein [Candidatus Levybacteria bacterium]MBI2622817.1 hypothetical protein [Candidatus Levybacteria bacterium]
MEKPNGQLTKDGLSCFLTLPEEEFLIARRKHWFLSAVRITGVFLLAFFFLFTLYFLFRLSSFLPSTLFLSMAIGIAVLALSLITKLIIDWYYHLYIVTTRKILEVCYSPLSSYKINDVLLDQVKCTEIDTKTNGILNELIDMGDITITFDRPTHQEEFIFTDIKNPKEMGIFLGNTLIDSVRQNIGATVWYRPKKKPGLFRFTEEMFPVSAEGGGVL